MDLCDCIADWAHIRGETPAFVVEREKNALDILSWRAFFEYACNLSSYLHTCTKGKREPIVVYGHKSPWMPVAFLACFLSGHAYCPVDISVPLPRVRDILETVGTSVVICLEPLSFEGGTQPVLGEVLDEAAVQNICKGEGQSSEQKAGEMASFVETIFTDSDANVMRPVQDDEVAYIIFTSGSSGKPKGVQVTAGNLYSFIQWVQTLVPAPTAAVPTYLNQAPFSFDLSVMDLYLSLTTGGTLYCLTKAQQQDPKRLYPALYRGEINVWVSTPSFADIALADPNFNAETLPQLQTFLFCGETLSKKTYEKLQKRFPEAAIYNTYGPTETTVAVTSIRVTPSLADSYAALPVGVPKPGTCIKVMVDDGQLTEEEGVRGELIIIGDTVSSGYLHAPDLTEKAFFTIVEGEATHRAYHTGDEGFLQDGLVFYTGRLDFQIKLNGYRIELGDIENNLMRLSEVQGAVVLPINRRDRIVGLKAFIRYAGPKGNSLELAKRLKEQLHTFLPAYMVPGQIVFVETFPVTQNGKVDRKALAAGKFKPE